MVALATSVIAAGILAIGALIVSSRRQNRRDALFFDGALQLADARLRAFALENGGAFVGGATDWKSFSYGWGRFGKGEYESSIRGKGSSVELQRDGLAAKISAAVEVIDGKFTLVPRAVIRREGRNPAASAGSMVWRWEVSQKPPALPSELSARACSACLSLAEVSSKIELWERALAVSASICPTAAGAAPAVDESGELARDEFEPARIRDLLERAEVLFRHWTPGSP